ncbi:MAG: ABC transporter permease [Arachidicoccus sp.]|nr:ABC transporter permease [Arachidicoccus sp.]
MFFKNLRFAFKVFKKNKATTAINILGLAVGISAAIVIFLIVRYDYSFDKWEPQKENIYRVYTTMPPFGTNSGISELAADVIPKSISGIQVFAHFMKAFLQNPIVTVSNKQTGKGVTFSKNDDVSFADGNYFKIFPHQWLQGSAASSLSQINEVVISKSEAEKYFPHVALDKVIGQSMIFEDSVQTIVTGVVADQKEHTDFDSKIFISLKTYKARIWGNGMKPDWRNVDGSSQFFILLNPKSNPENVNNQLKNLFIENEKGVNAKELWIGKLQPLSDIHFNTAIDGKVDKSSLRNLGLLALFLLLLAAINFINLSTAQSTLRAKEIGVRKTFGGNNKQIIHQFLTETFLVTICATLLAIIISPFLIYVFKGFIPDELDAKEMFQPIVIVFLLIMIVIVTLLAGLYPAFVLTKFRPALVIKNQVINKGKSHSVWVRQILTVSQFVLAQVFLVVVFVIGKQIHYELNKDIGMKKDAIIFFRIPDFLLKNNSKKYVLVNELKKIPQIQNITLCSAPPVRNGWNSTQLTWNNKGVKNKYDQVHVRTADENYVSLFGLQLLAGKNIHTDTSAKVTDVLINETLLHQMNLHNPQDAIGQYVSGGNSDSEQVVGVVKDFTTMSLHNPIYPTVIIANNDGYAPTLSFSLNGNNISEWKNTLNKIETAYKNIYPNRSFDYKFLDDTIKDLYKSDMRLSTLLKWATGLAIFISCLGLLGLVSFMANQKTKEIGIRKVLGASVMQIITLLSKSLVKLVILASVIAFPIGWYFSHKWLQDFSFKTTFSWWIFLISGIGMLTVALIVLCLRAMKAAKANPVDSLKTE